VSVRNGDVKEVDDDHKHQENADIKDDNVDVPGQLL
jgi:hypothetical protein